MIIIAIIALSAVVFVYLMSILNDIISIPLEFLIYVDNLIPYIASGIKFVNSCMYSGIVIPMAMVCLGLHSVFVTYRIAMWIIKKIPLFGVSD